MNRIILAIGVSSLCLPLLAADPAPKSATPSSTTPAATPAATPRPQVPPPTVADFHYGPHPKQVLDFYKAPSDKPTPLVFYIHGGGWVHGEKQPVAVANYLKNGISVVSIQYRFTTDAVAEGQWPPVEWPLHDAARALQTVRSKAREWNIDKTRIGATGGSAGACSSLWLDFHDDMADPKSSDPIAHESTRLTCAAVNVPQTTLDPQQMKEWTPNSKYGGHAFGFPSFAEFLAGRDKVMPWIKEYSPYEHVSSDDPPIYMSFPTAPALGQDQKDPTHTANFGVKLQEHCKEKGVSCELVYPGAPDVKHPKIEDFLIEMLKK
ncbi:putative lipase/esterase [Chthoniobacter flavus Ellin428]|uniref:Putative lipase/esterase n=1 Tax=Chthoniobacter flavus Ellin428 TaxID=497964 RepID=B4DC95_9BACT|nr:alpha/beta hydrolase [Chthoniobacter flavus]EDY15925.1 putative lipase/esterase [Chthoniobacter flavus Ellin428]TCO82516.1 acetyl esterase/lipase [Chthoniobacter flavus]